MSGYMYWCHEHPEVKGMTIPQFLRNLKKLHPEAFEIKKARRLHMCDVITDAHGMDGSRLDYIIAEQAMLREMGRVLQEGE